MARLASAISLSMRIATLTASTEFGLRDAATDPDLTGFDFNSDFGIFLL
jgi:hypothetical protein